MPDMSTPPHLSRFFVVALMAVLLAAGGFGYWKSRQDRLPEGLSMGNGRLEATEVQIASKTPGRLAQVHVDEGDHVVKGQLLARMDTRTLEAQRNQAEAEVTRARENLAATEANVQLRHSEQLLAHQELKRTQELFKRGYASEQTIDQQQARFDTANAAVNAARAQVSAAAAAIGASLAQVAQLTSEIDDSSLRAPIDGVIQLRLAEPGEVLGAGGRVLLMIDPNDQYMNLYLPASVAGKLTVGDEARLLLDALPERPLPATVSFVAAKSQFTPKEVETRDERQKLVFRVKIRLTRPGEVPQAKPGMPGAGYVRTAPVDWPANLQ
ncbi:efflux RND transporter periplasmic adaptor subunit [Pseudomonas sp. 21TX0197]|uniref:HlyD family secretion protein n=2 Tax=Pseudomonas TaxID=286 RepID=UPI000F461016|nr:MULTISPECIES: efflux RND transporter periplasmic adaptor subunit [Pseudomonas]MDB6442092.1 efflux RND transporter periplasmic adaptor subunit [Pseudomonas sp. 21TX0197]MDT8908424.1 efflux RND transporter periplasmic adaptor subunit [Pseudomonas prosekii]NHN71172.1 efflux RND transporter periplasmic adaptor subunit [Pseudomonas fluorescens]